jgi:hypothetical protein
MKIMKLSQVRVLKSRRDGTLKLKIKNYEKYNKVINYSINQLFNY